MSLSPRTKSCASCGAAFGCGPGAGDTAKCWCEERPAILPMGVNDCLCPQCLRQEITVRVGLCGTCLHAQTRKTKGGTATFLCALSATQPKQYPKYPRLPKGECAGYADNGK